jgi:hypothetical protein
MNEKRFFGGIVAKRATLKSFRLRLDVVLAHGSPGGCSAAAAAVQHNLVTVRPTVQHNAFEHALKPPQVFTFTFTLNCHLGKTHSHITSSFQQNAFEHALKPPQVFSRPIRASAKARDTTRL